MSIPHLLPCGAECGPCPPTNALTLTDLTVDGGCPGALAGSAGVYLDVGPIECAWSCTAGVMTITVDRIRYWDGTSWSVISGPFFPKSGYFWANTDPCAGCSDGTPYWNCPDPDADPPIAARVLIQLPSLGTGETLADKYQAIEVVCDSEAVIVAGDSPDPEPTDWALNRQTVKQDYSRSTSSTSLCTEGATAISLSSARTVESFVSQAIFDTASKTPCIREWVQSGSCEFPTCTRPVEEEIGIPSITTNGRCRNVSRNANEPNDGAVTLAGSLVVAPGDEFDGTGPGYTLEVAGTVEWRCGKLYFSGTMTTTWGSQPSDAILDGPTTGPSALEVPITDKIYFHDCTKCYYQVSLFRGITKSTGTGSGICAGAVYAYVLFNLNHALRVRFGRDAA